MSKVYFCLSASVLILSGFLASAGADQDAICTMDDGIHKAYYHCPDGYEVVYTGEGEKECDGKCYKRGDRMSLQNAIAELLVKRKVTLTSHDIVKTSNELLYKEQVLIVVPGGAIKLFAPKSTR